ncbi:transposase and inactivated derivatives [Candidatus Scalindua japonica]|uniref:Transposase IS66 n=1 Tax=Candidatus Scalindua japonica TaxID=1284222 RepID=A0A286TXD1_9BACT|nr:IS66 family transposase [Candidatus Scalindua japonica]GAX59969.1 transposase and inactivated derivatives [Candidatus Scalindua japonica]GAX60548.1 transposase IS66 [Candidatus Scalindua japonica]GAX62502.1 transposase and inactivated derivatives [Candidatus Scalindua japonica]
MEAVVEITDFSIENVLAQNDELRCKLESRDHQIMLLEEKINYLLYHRFSSKSERFDKRQQLLFGNEDAACEVEPATETKVPEHTRKTGGRRVPPQHLPRVRVEHDLLEEEKQCSCGSCLNRIGEEVSFQYDVIPARFQVIENIKFKYSCSNSKCKQPPITAQQSPPAPLPRTQASPGVLAWVGSSKFADGLPLNRIASIAGKRFGVPFTSTTLADWMIKGAEQIISPLVATMENALDGHDYLHIDETTLQVLSEEGRTAKQKSYIWCRVTGGNDTPIVLMHYSPSRAGAVASKLLEGFSGFLQTDGYAGYGASASRPNVIQLGCWAHVRRKFDVARKASSPGAANIARQGMELIRELYYLDNQEKEKPPDQRKRYRQEVVKSCLDKIRSWINRNQVQAFSYGGLLSNAFTYINNQWSKLTVFVEDGRLQLDNNNAERHIRPIATGRKVWLFAQSEAGARATATWYSLVETARANGLEPYWYLRKVFEEMPMYLRDRKPVNDLLPWNVDSKELEQLARRD